jgi:hypothetical protein
VCQALVLLLVVTVALPAGDAPVGVDLGDPPSPGLETPVAAADPCVLNFDWDEYHTTIVVGDGVGMVRPAWVATYELSPRRFIVGYRATAYRDARGRLHINAHQSTDVGPRSEEWSPDSFAFGSKLLWAMDDRGQGQSASMGTTVSAASDPTTWHQALLQIQGLVEGGL